VRVSCRDIARAVKEMTLVMANMRASARSPNLAIRQEYRALRLHVARSMRRLYEIRAAGDPVAKVVGFRRLERRVARYEDEADATFDLLVRDGRITSAMATSLMNDAQHAGEVVRLFTEAGKNLFVERGSALQAVRQELLIEAAPDASYDETLDGRQLLASASLTGEMRAIERRAHGQEEEDPSAG
jgi:hypothetical protein